MELVLNGDTLVQSIQESESHPCAIVATLSKLGRKSRTGFDPYCGCSFPQALSGSQRACGTPKSNQLSASHGTRPACPINFPLNGPGELGSESAIPTSMGLRNRGLDL